MVRWADYSKACCCDGREMRQRLDGNRRRLRETDDEQLESIHVYTTLWTPGRGLYKTRELATRFGFVRSTWDEPG